MVSILHFPGTNCHYDVYFFYKTLGYEVELIWHTQDCIPRDTRLVVIAGGFSYGDYLRCGAIAARSNIMRALKRYIDNGNRVLGICNGFQILCEAKILPGVLMRNANLKFISINARLEIISNDNAMLRHYERGDSIYIPIAHGEGNYQASQKDLESMYDNDQILLKYADDVNGSIDRIAGICNKEKNVFALMPHPERAVNDKLISRYAKCANNGDLAYFENIMGQNLMGVEMLKTLYNT